MSTRKLPRRESLRFAKDHLWQNFQKRLYLGTRAKMQKQEPETYQYLWSFKNGETGKRRQRQIQKGIWKQPQQVKREEKKKKKPGLRGLVLKAWGYPGQFGGTDQSPAVKSCLRPLSPQPPLWFQEDFTEAWLWAHGPQSPA